MNEDMKRKEAEGAAVAEIVRKLPPEVQDHVASYIQGVAAAVSIRKKHTAAKQNTESA